jgi:hypothetical protein
MYFQLSNNHTIETTYSFSIIYAWLARCINSEEYLYRFAAPQRGSHGVFYYTHIYIYIYICHMENGTKDTCIYFYDIKERHGKSRPHVRFIKAAVGTTNITLKPLNISPSQMFVFIVTCWGKNRVIRSDFFLLILHFRKFAICVSLFM